MNVLARGSALVFLASGLAAFTGRAAPSVDEEPPLGLILEVGGQAVDVELERPFEVSIEGRSVPMKLLAKPTRHFSFAGIEFDYLRHLSFSVTDDSGLVVWTLDGDDCVIMVQKYPRTILDELLPMVVDITAEQYGEVPIVEADVSLDLGGRKVGGKRLVVTMAGIQLQQDFFGVQVGNAAVLLVVQGTLNDDGTLTRESQDATALLEKSFRLTR